MEMLQQNLQTDLMIKSLKKKWVRKQQYRRWSNGFKVGHWLSNIFNSFLEIQVLIENLLCLDWTLQEDEKS